MDKEQDKKEWVKPSMEDLLVEFTQNGAQSGNDGIINHS